ncbi:MAG: SDR family NAD(P)-dependent oxidoreductase [Alphaproteobacteria bacterium]|nr:SDR family NAD(P)-dependent oxidoreductase [Alphaproteobacteria bacterium]
MLDSFDKGSRAVVIGASGGIGKAFTEKLGAEDCFDEVFAFSRSDVAWDNDTITPGHIDLLDEGSIRAAAENAGDGGPLHLVIVATGMLHEGDEVQPEKTFSSLERDQMERGFAINTIGPALIAKHFLPLMDREARNVFAALSARVGSIGDNYLGGWYTYRASKAALNMMLRGLSIEVGRKNEKALVIGLHPGTVDTALSDPFQGNVPDEKLFTPDYATSKLLEVIDGLGPDQTGKIFAWDGEAIPY